MPLGRINFSNVSTFEALPSGEYFGKTSTWEDKLTNAGDSINIEAKFVLDYTDDKSGIDRTRTQVVRWNLKDQSLWRIKRDLQDLGVPESDFEGEDVDLEGILNQVFGTIPTPVRVLLTQRTYTPPDGGEPRTVNEVVRCYIHPE